MLGVLRSRCARCLKPISSSGLHQRSMQCHVCVDVDLQADTRLPRRYLDRCLTDASRMQLTEQAVVAAVHDVRGRGLDCRVLVLGAGAGLIPLMALRAGAFHVTCVERSVQDGLIQCLP